MCVHVSMLRPSGWNVLQLLINSCVLLISEFRYYQRNYEPLQYHAYVCLNMWRFHELTFWAAIWDGCVCACLCTCVRGRERQESTWGMETKLMWQFEQPVLQPETPFTWPTLFNRFQNRFQTGSRTKNGLITANVSSGSGLSCVYLYDQYSLYWRTKWSQPSQDGRLT